jgi:hypothetical protein
MKGKVKDFDECVDREIYAIKIIVKAKGERKIKKVYEATGKVIEISNCEDKYRII